MSARACGATLVVLGSLLLAGPALGQERQQRQTPPRAAPRTDQRTPDMPAALVDRFGARVAEALGLDRSQRERLIAELQRSRRERAALAQRRRELLRSLTQLVQSESPDQARVESLFQEFLELRVRQAEIDVAEDRRLAAFLTPLQRARLFHLKQRLAERALDVERRGRENRRP